MTGVQTCALPISRAFAQMRDPNLIAESIQAFTGKGLSAEIAGQEYRLGRADFAWTKQTLVPPEQEGQWLLFADNQTPLCWFRLSDQLRSDSQAMLAELRDMGITFELLSGDQEGSVKNIAKELGITHFTANATPELKLEHLKMLQNRGRQEIGRASCRERV